MDPQDAMRTIFDGEGAFDVLSCDDLSTALAACAPPLPSATDPLPEAVLKTLRAGIDGCLLLEHTVPHRVLPQLLRPVVGPYIEGRAVDLRNAADASLCVRAIVARDDMFHALALYARHLHHVTSVEDGTGECDYDMRAYVAPEMQTSLRYLDVSGSRHVSTKAIRRLSEFKQLTHLDVSFCSSLRTTALPLIAQFTNLEVLDIQGLQQGRRNELTKAIVRLDAFARLTRLRALTLGWHRLLSLAPLRHLPSLEEIDMESVTYPSKDLRHLAGLSRLQTLTIAYASPCLLGISRLSHLTTLSLRGRSGMTPGEIEEVKCCAFTALVLPRTDKSWTFAAIQLVRSMPTLTSLSMYNVTADALVDIARSLPRLKALSFLSCPATVATLHGFPSLERLTLKSKDGCVAIPAVDSLPHLQHLELSRLDVLDASAIRPWAAFRSLTHLEVSAASCNHSSFDAFKDFTMIEVLEVCLGSNQPFSDDVAKGLGGMPRLRKLCLGASAEVTQLYQRTLPGVQVS